MSARVAKLEELLARVQRNAVAPRPVSAVGAGAGSAQEPDETQGDFADLDEPDEHYEAASAAGAAPDLDEPGDDDIMDLDEIEDLEEVDGVEDFAGEDLDLEPSDQEPPPESHSSPVASDHSVARAIDEAGEQPPLTPPPESGEEPAPEVKVPASEGPTMEQLGETIHLDEGPDRDFELDEPTLDAPAEEAESSKAESSKAESSKVESSKLEAPLPASAGAYDDDVKLPPEASKELERVRLGEQADVRPQIISRPVISTNVVDFVAADRAFEPATFSELLDATLKL